MPSTWSLYVHHVARFLHKLSCLIPRDSLNFNTERVWYRVHSKEFVQFSSFITDSNYLDKGKYGNGGILLVNFDISMIYATLQWYNRFVIERMDRFSFPLFFIFSIVDDYCVSIKIKKVSWNFLKKFVKFTFIKFYYHGTLNKYVFLFHFFDIFKYLNMLWNIFYLKIIM